MRWVIRARGPGSQPERMNRDSQGAPQAERRPLPPAFSSSFSTYVKSKQIQGESKGWDFSSVPGEWKGGWKCMVHALDPPFQDSEWELDSASMRRRLRRHQTCL